MIDDQRPTVYGASKMNCAMLWHDLASKHPDIRWTARWPSLELLGTQPTPGNSKSFWLQDVADIQKADYVLVLPPQFLVLENKPYESNSPEEFFATYGSLRGAIFEAGVAIGLGKPVVLVGECPDYGTWQYHPLISRFPTIEEAIQFIKGNWE